VASDINSLATIFPDIAAEWHSTRNGKLSPRDVTAKSHRNVWWKCKNCTYEWPTAIHMRTINKSGCPLCSHDAGALKREQIKFEKSENELQNLINYDFETDGTEVGNAQALRQMLSNIKTEPELRKIESLFSPRLRMKINHQPYYQRNYVWNTEKATYFIESVMIGTEVPPLIFFETSDNQTEVIDGRQRFETLERFKNNMFSLSSQGLTIRTDLANKKFDDLSNEDKILFYESKLRIIRFSVVSSTSFDENTFDLLKKEIFRRYNSGITPLRQLDVEKAIFISDEPSNHIKYQFKRNKNIYESFLKLFLGVSKESKSDEVDLLEKALQEFRFLLVCAEMPILTTRKKETLQQFYELFASNVTDTQTLYRSFAKRIQLIEKLNEYFIAQNVFTTKFWNEVLYWALAILNREDHNEEDIITEERKASLFNLYQSNEKVYAPAESQFFYSQFLKRYSTIADFLERCYGLSMGPYLRKRNKIESSAEPSTENEETVQHVRIEKQDPIPITVEELCSDLARSKYLLRPAYQRKEVINKTKSSGIIESMLLGMKLPPLYAFKRNDGISEIIDGQQRILSIIGYLGQPFLNEEGKQLRSNKDQYKLSKLRILSDLSGKEFAELDEKLRNRILDYNLSIITIDEKFNLGFNAVDLFIRLNSRPYPIKENSFEMWNSYVDKEIVVSIKEITMKYAIWLYISKENLRMRNEELITAFVYLENTQLEKSSFQSAIENVVDVYRRGEGIGVRIKQKAAITRMLDMATISNDKKEETLEAIKRAEAFTRKIKTLLTDSNTEDDASLERQLTNLFNVSKKKYYSRRYHDYYALWYLLYDLPLAVAIKRRVEICADLNNILVAMKEETTEMESFNKMVNNFKNKYAIAERKIKLTYEEKKALIIKQNNICPLCNSAVYLTDDIAVDHILPIAVQGPDEKENLQLVHKLCNEQKWCRTSN
jgi:hypothetical protein